MVTQLMGEKGVSTARVTCMWCRSRRAAGGGGALLTEFHVAEGVEVESPHMSKLKIAARWA